MKDKRDDLYLAEEISNALTHAVGGYLGAAALVLLIIFAIQSGEQVPWKVVSGSIFGATIIILYSASTIYHAVTNIRAKEICRAFDMMAIYALIAGTYTPFCLVTLRQINPILSWTIFGFVWGLTLAGIIMRIFATSLPRWFTTVPYLAMGWFGLVLLKPLYDNFPLIGIAWLVLGGVLYSIGVVFYLMKFMPFHHTVWHLFVLAGTICHFFCILFYVMM